MRIMNLIFLGLMLLPLALSAQNNQKGKIIYQQERTIEFDESRYEQMSEEQRNKMKERMKKWGKEKKTLVFNKEASVYRNFKAEKDAKDPATWESESGGGRGHWRRMKSQSIIYLSHTDQTVVEQQEAFDKKFLIEAPVEEKKWKITGKQEMLSGHRCMHAVWQKNDSTTVEAWFAPQIPVSSGPNGYGGLPGMVLKVDVNQGEFVMVAKEVRLEEVDETIVKPDKGKKVSREEFEKIMKEKREEMREMRGGSRGHGH